MGALVLPLVGFGYMACGIQELSFGHRRAGQCYFLVGILVVYYTLLLIA